MQAILCKLQLQFYKWFLYLESTSEQNRQNEQNSAPSYFHMCTESFLQYFFFAFYICLNESRNTGVVHWNASGQKAIILFLTRVTADFQNTYWQLPRVYSAMSYPELYVWWEQEDGLDTEDTLNLCSRNPVSYVLEGCDANYVCLCVPRKGIFYQWEQ